MSRYKKPQHNVASGRLPARRAYSSKRGYARFYEPEGIAGFEEIIRIQPRLNPGYMLQEDTRLVNEMNLIE
jgi:hypothetical protein